MSSQAPAPCTLELPALAAALGRALRGAGVPVTPDRAARFARALALSPPADRTALYWVARTTLCSAREQLPAFDRVFATVFDGLGGPAALRGDPSAPPLSSPGAVALPSRRPAAEQARATPSAPARGELKLGLQDHSAEQRDSAEVAIPAASDVERLAQRDFATLDAEELRALRTLMSDLQLSPPPRPGRRTRRDRHGALLDLRATLRRGSRTGGDPARLLRRRRRERPRRLVAICDVSGSMEPYTRAYLQLLHAAVGGARAEAFVFATRLTRVTRALAERDADAALARAAAAVQDWSGGTRLGEALRRFNDQHGRRGLARGAVVVILSDGWERGDPDFVAREMERLARLAHRIVWVNPRRAAPGFAPLAGGMAAALPFCDAFVSGHSADALAEVLAAVRGGSG
jgi:uncharacterized protein with von Willebrand factor type A (vWA) domain